MATSFDFLKGVNPTFRRKIDPMFVSMTNVMDKYRIHIKETPEAEQKTPEMFLSEQDFVLEMMAKEFDCYDDVLWTMREWAKT